MLLKVVLIQAENYDICQLARSLGTIAILYFIGLHIFNRYKEKKHKKTTLHLTKIESGHFKLEQYF
jgi:hypothetical protein